MHTINSLLHRNNSEPIHEECLTAHITLCGLALISPPQQRRSKPSSVNYFPIIKGLFNGRRAHFNLTVLAKLDTSCELGEVSAPMALMSAMISAVFGSRRAGVVPVSFAMAVAAAISCVATPPSLPPPDPPSLSLFPFGVRHSSRLNIC